MSGVNAVQLTQEKDFRFAVDFGGGRPLLYADKGAPLGQGSGSNPEQLLSAAVGNCLTPPLLVSLPPKFVHVRGERNPAMVGFGQKRTLMPFDIVARAGNNDVPPPGRF